MNHTTLDPEEPFDVAGKSAWLREMIEALQAPENDEVLAYCAVMSYLDAHLLPEDLRDALQRIHWCIALSPELYARVCAMRQRMLEIAQTHNAVAQFERLTGHLLDSDCLAASQQ